MRNKKLSVWSYPFRKTYYLTHPWKWIHDTYWNFRNWIHRANYGYAYVDVWNFCDWYPRVGAEALCYLAAHNSGWPGTDPWKTPEEWREYLEYLANRLERCANSQDICFGEDRNEYREELDKIMERRKQRTEHEDGSVTISHTLTPEEEEIRKKYWEREKEIRDADQAYNVKTFRWLGEDLPFIWD